MEEENEGIFNPHAQKLGKKIKEKAKEAKEYLSPKRRAVGAQILKEHDYLWEDIIDGCRQYKIKMSPDFMEFMCKSAIKTRDMYFPIAKASGMEPIAFALERQDRQAEIMKNNKNWIEETDNLHNNITKETDENLLV